MDPETIADIKASRSWSNGHQGINPDANFQGAANPQSAHTPKALHQSDIHSSNHRNDHDLVGISLVVDNGVINRIPREQPYPRAAQPRQVLLHRMPEVFQGIQ